MARRDGFPVSPPADGVRLKGAYALITLALAALLFPITGCRTPREWIASGFKVGPNYCPPAVEVAEDWIDADDQRVLSDPVEHAAWWAVFDDPVLNELVAQAYNQNLTVRQAGQQILQARAMRALAAGNLFPQAQSFGASYSHNLSPGFAPDRHFSTWQGSFSLAWEIDFWGQFRRAVEAADADLDESIFAYGDAVVTLVADVAQTYIDIRTTQTRLELATKNLANQRETYNITERIYEAGDASQIDVQQARTSYAQTQSIIPQLELLLRQQQNQLCVLLGIPPEDLSQRLGMGKVPDVSPDIALGIPAATLLRRPDVRQAERALAAQSAVIGVAEAALYPSITLTGSLGRTANQFADVFNPGAGFGSVGPSLNWDILNYGRLLANIDVQDALFQQLLTAYRQTVLIANLEAENAITQFLKTQEIYDHQLEAAEAAGLTNERIKKSLSQGEVNYNRLIAVQNAKTAQDEAATIAKGNVAQSVVEIYRALGGGWPSPYLGEALASNPLAPPAGIEPDLPEEVDAEPATAVPPAPLIIPGEQPVDVSLEFPVLETLR